MATRQLPWQRLSRQERATAAFSSLGMSIAANKVKGAYAALLTDVYSAQRAVLSNNANIACMGTFTIGEKLAVELLKTFLSLSFDPNSSSASKVACYRAYDQSR